MQVQVRCGCGCGLRKGRVRRPLEVRRAGHLDGAPNYDIGSVRGLLVVDHRQSSSARWRWSYRGLIERAALTDARRGRRKREKEAGESMIDRHDYSWLTRA